MKLKSSLVLGLLTLAAIVFSGCETTASTPAVASLGGNEARVTGHKSALAYSVLITPASQLKEADWKNVLVIPAGPNRLAVRYHAILSGGAIGAATEALNVVEIEFQAEAGHEYYAEMWGMTVFNMGFKITDKTTGKIAGQAKVSKNNLRRSDR